MEVKRAFRYLASDSPEPRRGKHLQGVSPTECSATERGTGLRTIEAFCSCLILHCRNYGNKGTFPSPRSSDLVGKVYLYSQRHFTTILSYNKPFQIAILFGHESVLFSPLFSYLAHFKKVLWLTHSILASPLADRFPSSHCCRIPSNLSCGTMGSRPNFTPLAFAAAIPSFCLCRINSRSV